VRGLKSGQSPPAQPNFNGLTVNYLQMLCKLTRDRVVPFISASVSWLIFAMIGSGLPYLPKFANSRSIRASHFSLESNN
jgi:hypothetical protein